MRFRFSLYSVNENLSFFRFGTGTVSVRTGGTGQEEELKRKARAERCVIYFYLVKGYINQVPISF